jgi:tRNA(Ile)-lysidine synthase
VTNVHAILPPDHRDQGVARIGAALRDRCGVSPGATLVLAVSGGADSCALMLACASLAARPHLGYRLVVGHVDHQLRGEASSADAAAVRGWAERLGLTAEVATVRIEAVDDANVEAAARRLRYEALAGIGRGHGAAAVLTGHTEDDQLETMLMALVRGAGPRGMGGMPWRRPLEDDIALVRPMLAVSHDWAESICAAAGLQWRQDETNVDTDRLRAAVRHEVIPQLRALRPGVGRRAVQTADLLRDAAGLVEDQADRAMGGVELCSGMPARSRRRAGLPPGPRLGDADLWSRTELCELRDVVLGAGLRAAIERAGRGQAMDGVTHERIRACIRAIRDDRTDPRRFQFGGHIVVHVAAEVVAVTIEPPDNATGSPE